jgi:hypothetical protein
VSVPERRDPGGADLLASGRERERGRGGVPAWVWRVTGLLVLGLVAVVAGPRLLSSPGPQPSPPPRPPTQSAPLVPLVLPRPVPPLRWAPRGPEVGSAVAVAAVARLRALRPGVDRLLWAGSLDGHDHLVVVSYRRRPNLSPEDPIEVAALHVRRARDVATANGETIGYLGGAGSFVGVAWRGGDQRTRLLVLGRPTRLRVQVSSVVDYDPIGRDTRRWRDARLTHGVVVTDLGRQSDPVIVVRSTDRDATTSPAIIQVEGLPDLPSPDEVRVNGASSPAYAGPNAQGLAATLARAVSPLFDLRDADSTVVWSGKLAGGEGHGAEPRRIGRGALVLVRRDDGPMFQAFVYGAAGFLKSYPAIPVRWSVAGRLPYIFLPYEPGSPHMIINPSGPGSATFTPTVGRPLRVRLDGHGVGTLPADSSFATRVSGSRVVVRDASGRIVLRSTMVNPDTANPFTPYLR